MLYFVLGFSQYKWEYISFRIYLYVKSSEYKQSVSFVQDVCDVEQFVSGGSLLLMGFCQQQVFVVAFSTERESLNNYVLTVV